ncbi:unnamed protein product [Rotaria socialis]|uniref:Uncharacterized protein n=1 Tax=Rotaria socialis TaxID=392032 RepID=A0A818FAK1_9BILA|nr:unnamed protein product [Rotaria socialis]CAF3425066.1 unnamed protein product [Rotaria socialis]CAF3470807.1 unnamed protein product [Rotaria socialis]
MVSKLDRFFNPKDGTYANVPIIPVHPEKFRGKRPFSNNILIGNWYEDQLKFNESLHRSKTMYTIDYPAHVGSIPDTVLRRKILAAHNQKPGRLILDHHDIDDRKQHISSYDEQYNKRGAYGEHQDTSERKWLILEKRWIPERSDHPLEATPTSWGLIVRKRSQSQSLRRQRTMPEVSEYAGRYVAHPPEEYSSSKTSGIPHIYTRAIDRKNSFNNVIKQRCMTDFSCRQPITTDSIDPDYTYSLRRSTNVPRALFYLGKLPNQITRKHLPLETESTNPVLAVTSSIEQIQSQEQPV